MPAKRSAGRNCSNGWAVASPASYRPVFSGNVADFLLALPKSSQRKVLRLARQLAANPMSAGDYRLRDESGREIEHVLIEDFVFAYWVDHAVREVRLAEIEDAS
jgi:hypothetical protein